MPINPNCRAILGGLGLPMDVCVRDRHGHQITTATIHPDGTITDLTSGTLYASPSVLRHVLIEPNGQTYSRLFRILADGSCDPRSLHDLGVQP